MGKRKKEEKDPNAPKRAPNAYMCFAKSVRKEVTEKNKGAKVSGVAKVIGEMWAELPDKDKEPFIKESDKLKAEYAEAMKNYKPKKKSPSKTKPAKKAKTSPKKSSPKKKTPAKKKEEETDEEEEEEEEEEEAEEAEEEGLSDEMKEAIKKICNGDDEVTMRKIRESLKETFPEEEVDAKKQLIKEYAQTQI